MKKSPLVRLAIAVAVLGIISSSTKADWLQFRGENGAGISTDKNIPVEWSEKKNLKWKLELPGRGFSSPIVVGKKVFLTTYTGADGNLSSLERTLVCVDRDTGKIIWKKSTKAVLPEFRTRGNFAYHGYASSSPVSDGERVYVMYGTTGVIAYDLDGKQLWQKSVGTQTNARFGSSSSPMLYKDFVIATAGSESGAMYAFDKKTGKQVWKSDASSLSDSYSTPIIVKNPDGEDELVVPVLFEAWGLNPMTGKLRWYVETRTDTAACPLLVANEGVVYSVGGRNGGRTAFKTGGKGDITRTNSVWSENGGTYVSSPVFYKGHLYYGTRNGMIMCVDAKTGKEAARARARGDFYSSGTVIDGKLYVTSRFNGTYVFEANPKMKQLAHNTFENDDSDTSGTPAIDNGQLFMRSDKYLYCITQK